MENTNRSIQGRTDETEIAETVATTLEYPVVGRQASSSVLILDIAITPVSRENFFCRIGVFSKLQVANALIAASYKSNLIY